MSIHANFVIARGTGRRVTWQINGAGPRLSIRLAWSRLADLCPRPEIADELGRHEAKLDIEIRDETGQVREHACVTTLGWSTRAQWEIGRRALARLCPRTAA